MQSERLVDLVTQALDDMKGQQIRVLDVRGKTPLADYMVVASGTSNRHVKSLADAVVVRAKDSGVRALGIEGQEGQEWVLVDLNDVIVHVMLPKVRDFYNLEKLWLAEDGNGGVAASPGSEPVPGPDLVRRMRR